MKGLKQAFHPYWTALTLGLSLTNKERMKDITDSIERGIEELFQSDKYAEYLRTMSCFTSTA